MILIIGKGGGKTERLTNGHLLMFRESARDNSIIVSLKQYDFVFQHLNPPNSEAEEAIKEWINNEWNPKLIGFSGGVEIPSKWDQFNIAKISGLDTKQTILDLNWSAVPADFSGNAHELVALLKPQPLEFLPVLAILCQGYLAVHAEYRGMNRDWENGDIAHALERMGWTDFMAKDGTNLPLIKPSLGSEEDLRQVREADWWLEIMDVLNDEGNIVSEKWQEFGNTVRREWNEARYGVASETLTAFLGDIKDRNAVASPRIVAEVYCTIADRLEGKVKHNDF